MKTLTSIILTSTLLLGCATTKKITEQQENTRLEVRASPRIGLSSPTKPHRWMVIGEIKGPETQRYYCPKATFVANPRTPYEVKSSQESDCIPYQDRNKTIYNQSERCKPYIKDGELYIPSQTIESCFPTEPQGFPRRWTKRYSAYTPGEYEVCIELSKREKVFARQCATSTVGGRSERW